MDKISLTTKLEQGLSPQILKRMARIYATTPGLSRRSSNELKNLYRRGYLVFAQKDSKLVGWIIRSPLSRSFWEVSGAYIEDSLRSGGIFKEMLRETLGPSSNYIIVTFLPTLADYLTMSWGFHRATLKELIYRTRGTFILDRLHPLRIFSIFQQLRKGRAYYLIRERYE